MDLKNSCLDIDYQFCKYMKSNKLNSHYEIAIKVQDKCCILLLRDWLIAMNIMELSTNLTDNK